ncbi:hypothetical protein EVAR_13053_1 [Eumeta japonica]|uniref:Uncharacterized protein n=1 Tax=Eumeta variegata TaxID=151549 RepID=A0A4C1VH80_EUMVA|nr:hypothetical protein EVAR_13053_1 [Eumeta japonica]
MVWSGGGSDHKGQGEIYPSTRLDDLTPAVRRPESSQKPVRGSEGGAKDDLAHAPATSDRTRSVALYNSRLIEIRFPFVPKTH